MYGDCKIHFAKASFCIVANISGAVVEVGDSHTLPLKMGLLHLNFREKDGQCQSMRMNLDKSIMSTLQLFVFFVEEKASLA